MDQSHPTVPGSLELEVPRIKPELRALRQHLLDRPQRSAGDCERRRPRWPALAELGLSPGERERRNRAIGGSDANTICSGNFDRILRLWHEKRGETECEDFSDVLPAMLGNWTEQFNRLWYQKLSGNEITRVGDAMACASHAWRRCTLDGFVESQGAIWEAKHTSAFVTRDQLLERYMPQLQHNMAVMRAERAILSVIFGNHKYEIVEVASDWLYQEELLEAERHFWQCVLTGDPPSVVERPPAPRPMGIREVCLERNNAWAAAAADWLKHRDAAKAHGAATAALKQMVEEDVARAFGHGIEARRSKAGAISIRELGR